MTYDITTHGAATLAAVQVLHAPVTYVWGDERLPNAIVGQEDAGSSNSVMLIDIDWMERTQTLDLLVLRSGTA